MLEETKRLDSKLAPSEPEAEIKSPLREISEAESETDSFQDADGANSSRSLTERRLVASGNSRSLVGGSVVSRVSAFEDKTKSNDSKDTKAREVRQDKKVEPNNVQQPATGKPSSKADAVTTTPPDTSVEVLDNVDLDTDTTAGTNPCRDDEKAKIGNDIPAVSRVASPKELSTETPPETASDEVKEWQKEPSKALSFSSITSAMPSMPWSPPTQQPQPRQQPATLTKPAAAAKPIPPSTTRKISSPFAWLSRNTSPKDQATSPPPMPSPRRNTGSSVNTLISNLEMMLSKLEEDVESDEAGARNSLKKRFNQLRMREEAIGPIRESREEEERHDGDNDDDDARPRPNSPPQPTKLASVHGAGSLGITEVKEAAPQLPAGALPPSPNPSLPPGTVAGATAGPAASQTEVDWDLWQSVVYEGPAAVARTSAEDLSRAIAQGIPSAIRGVIWQVLAQSKNEGLEKLYRELAARGTDQEKKMKRQSNDSAPASSTVSMAVQKEPASASPASSVHSSESPAATAATNGTTTPVDKEVATLKSQAAAAAAEAARKKKEKEDAAMLAKLEKTIRRDLGGRTSFFKFDAAQGLQEALFGVCKAYALFDEGVGYAQGMNFLIMPLLFNMPDTEAFTMLVRLMTHYHLRDLFIQDMPGLHLRLYHFERLLEDLEPALYCHLHRRGISPHLYATQWFLTLFAYRFPLQLVLRIYDLILSEGLSAILKFGIALMQKNATTLLGLSDMSQLTNFLKDRLFDVYIDRAPSSHSILENGFFGSSSSGVDKEVYRADEMVRDACDVRIMPELLEAYTAEWKEKTRIEKERETEIDRLKSSNAALTVKVRRLEEQLETMDREQTDLANSLVHTQLENQELKDENEGLRGQVHELRHVIEQQPAELEQAWAAERAELVRQNNETSTEKEKLAKELAELEEELVQTKMRYAEINSQHETLSRRWTDLKRQLI